MLQKIRSFSITMWIFIGMIIGITAGFIIGEPAGNVSFIGTIWIRMMKISLAPIVLVMIAKSIGEQQNGKKIGFVAVGILIYYTFTTFLASIIGIIVASLTKVGVGFSGLDTNSEANFEATEMSIESFGLSLMPDNLLKPLVETTMLQVLVIGVIMGAAILALPDNKVRNSILNGLNCLQSLLNGMLKISMCFAPIGVACSMAALIGVHGGDILGSIAGFIGTMTLGLILQFVCVYAMVVLIFAKENPFTFLVRMLPSMMIALTTSSSLLVVPSNLAVCRKYKIDEEISNFTIPLGAVFNLDGAAVFFPCVILFAAQASGIEFSLGTLLYMAIMGTVIASSGGGIVGGSLVKCMVLCELFSVPSSIITLITSVYIILDALITVCNASGDVAGTLMIGRIVQRRKLNVKQ
ncbi:MAG: dicarboxylate/amino acid:cation symporter [Eubacteriales bacterium]|nr:dicarboxylate/amino acid:cation symporter [Eubacteriales bacterium]